MAYKSKDLVTLQGEQKDLASKIASETVLIETKRQVVSLALSRLTASGGFNVRENEDTTTEEYKAEYAAWRAMSESVHSASARFELAKVQATYNAKKERASMTSRVFKVGVKASHPVAIFARALKVHAQYRAITSEIAVREGMAKAMAEEAAKVAAAAAAVKLAEEQKALAERAQLEIVGKGKGGKGSRKNKTTILSQIAPLQQVA